MKTMRQRLADKTGSSIVSVLVAFIILLLGIGAFATAVGTANDMVRRAEVLNAATGQVLELFYQDYAMTPVDNRNFVTSVNQITLDENGEPNIISDPADPPFKIHTKLRVKKYELTMKDQNGGAGSGDGSDSGEGDGGSDSGAEPGTTKLTYEMFYYK